MLRPDHATGAESGGVDRTRPPGTFGTAAPYYNDYRWQRQPAESLSLGRIFRMQGE